jgi:hypothetical protein
LKIRKYRLKIAERAPETEETMAREAQNTENLIELDKQL